MNRFFDPSRAKKPVQNRSIGTLAERAQARYRRIKLQCTKTAQNPVLFGHFAGT
jgi:hypothetical protein